MTTLEEAVLPTIKKTWATGNGMTITHMCIMIPQKKKSMYKRNRAVLTQKHPVDTEKRRKPEKYGS